MKIIVINGCGGCGKDSFVDECRKYCNVLNLSTIDCIKALAKQVGWTGQKTERDRKFLSDLKDLLSAYNNYSFNDVISTIEKEGNDYDIVFVHCREPQEIAKFTAMDNCIAILVDPKDRIPHITSNHADAEVYNYNYDYIIDNSGSKEDLTKSAELFCMLLLADMI